MAGQHPKFSVHSMFLEPFANGINHLAVHIILLGGGWLPLLGAVLK